MQIPEFTKEDFEQGTSPYEFLFQYQNDGFVQEQIKSMLIEQAKSHRVKNFVKRFTEYVKAQKKACNAISLDNVTMFEGQEVELITGNWRADEYGISTNTPFGEVYACNHPVMPVQRLVNIDTGVEKISLAYRKGKNWRHVIVDRRTISSATSIVGLSDFGIGVNSENAKYLVRYLHDVEYLNFDQIEEKSSVSRLGWIDGEGFSPYVDKLVFDGELSYKSFFESVKPRGNFETWLNMANEIRKNGVYARIILAAAFASVLVQPLGCLPFFVHLWGGTEVGKSVGLMLAASVWANPEMGKYIHTFNSTAVGREKSAGFVNSLPLIFDELQIISDKKSFDNDIYMLSEGIGRSRGAKTGGIQKLETWRNVILTSGEMPLTGTTSGGGAVNRIVEIECKEKLFQNPRDIANLIRKNYGHAGKMFVEKLQEDDNIEKANSLYRDFYARIINTDTTEKQSMGAALILVADLLATEWIFKDDCALTMDEIVEFLQTKASVSVNDRAYEYICEYVVQNANKFCEGSDMTDVWGKFENNQVHIVNREFERICRDGGFNASSLKSWLKSNGKLECSADRMTKKSRINGYAANCVVMQLQQNELGDIEYIDEII